MTSSKSTVYPRTTAEDDRIPMDDPLLITNGRSNLRPAQQLLSETASDFDKIKPENKWYAFTKQIEYDCLRKREIQNSRDWYEMKPSKTIGSLITVVGDYRVSAHCPSLITYGESSSKSSQELLFEAASQLDQGKAGKKWTAFTNQVERDCLRPREIQKLIHNLDERKQWSALHYAVANNNLFVAKILLGKTDLPEDHSYKCNINILGGHGENALHVAAQSKKLWNSDQSQDIIRMLIEWFNTNSKIDHEDDEGRTPLHLAVMANRRLLVSDLLNNGAHIEAKTAMNANVFHFMFIPSDPLQTAEDLDKMLYLLYNEAYEKGKSYLLHSRTLDNRSPLVFAVSHGSCTPHIINKFINEMDLYQLLLAFDFAAKRSIAEGNFHFCRLQHCWMDL
ncbi:unnamed protein product [Rotaria sordida]|uniref:Uncharacterized protein n=1 Tax=Rotaria sordida TaxID=392033 RepID=A0A815S4E5_9BILA|nr:unnamed protein product [Rotaria sordida]CAF4163409.1 unnamed protein product [Rotaria sordida]